MHWFARTAVPLAALALAGCPGATDDDATPDLLAEPMIVHHPKQPMIVDVVVEVDAPADVALTHDGDPGVTTETIDERVAGQLHTIRVRGLEPGVAHEMTLAIAPRESGGAASEHAVAFTTDPPLPGFVPRFDVEVSDPAAVDPVYRMFDYADSTDFEPSGLFVIDTEGVTRWYFGNASLVPGTTAIWAGVEMLDDGSLLTVRDGALIRLDELGEMILGVSSASYGLAPYHHDAIAMSDDPDTHYLVLGNSYEDVDLSSLGMDPETHMAGDLIVEIDQDGDVVWVWDTFDHLDPLRLRSDPGEGLPYVNPFTGQEAFDWTHGNGLVYTDDGVILLSLRHQDWIVAVDRDTSEVLWRLGDEGDFELLAGSWFWHQHSPQWQADGSLLLYDNGVRNLSAPPEQWRSRAVRYVLDFEAMTATQVWDDSDVEPFVSLVAGDTDRMPGGHLLTVDTAMQNFTEFDLDVNQSRLREYADDGDSTAVWSMWTDVGTFVYRAVPTSRLPGEASAPE